MQFLEFFLDASILLVLLPFFLLGCKCGAGIIIFEVFFVIFVSFETDNLETRKTIFPVDTTFPQTRKDVSGKAR